MNNLTVCLVFFSGVFCSFIFTFLSSQYVPNESLNEQLARRELIVEKKRKILEQSKKLFFIPEESQLSLLVSEEEHSIDSLIFETIENEHSKTGKN